MLICNFGMSETHGIPYESHIDLIVLIAASVVLTHSHDEIEHSHKCADGIWITAEHDVAETDIVVCSDVAGGHPCEGGLERD